MCLSEAVTLIELPSCVCVHFLILESQPTDLMGRVVYMQALTAKLLLFTCSMREKQSDSLVLTVAGFQRALMRRDEIIPSDQFWNLSSSANTEACLSSVLKEPTSLHTQTHTHTCTYAVVSSRCVSGGIKCATKLKILYLETRVILQGLVWFLSALKYVLRIIFSYYPLRFSSIPELYYGYIWMCGHLR